MFQRFDNIIHLYETETTGKLDAAALQHATTRTGPRSLEILTDYPGIFKTNDLPRTDSGQPQGSQSSMAGSSHGAKVRQSFNFEKIVGPKAESLKLYQEVKRNVDQSCLNTIINVSMYLPVMVDLNDSGSLKTILPNLLKDVSLDKGSDTFNVQLSFFAFKGGSLIPILQSETTQMLSSFELPYVEFEYKELSSIQFRLKSALGQKLQEFNHEVNSTFIYVNVPNTNRPPSLRSTSSLPALTHRYLLCDVFQALAKQPDSNGNVIRPELSAFMKAFNFTTRTNEITDGPESPSKSHQEHFDSLEILLSELVQEKEQRVTFIISIPVNQGASAERNARRLLDIASEFEKISTIFNSALFRLVHSEARRNGLIPLRHSEADVDEDIASRMTSARKSMRKSKKVMDSELPLPPQRESRSVSRPIFEERSKAQPPQVPADPLKSLKDRYGDLSNSDNISVVLSEIVSDFENRHQNKSRLVDLQNQILVEQSAIFMIKKESTKSLIEEYENSLKKCAEECEYLKYLLKCVADYRHLKDDSQKAKIRSAVNSLTSLLSNKTIDSLLGLLESL